MCCRLLYLGCGGTMPPHSKRPRGLDWLALQDDKSFLGKRQGILDFGPLPSSRFRPAPGSRALGGAIRESTLIRLRDKSP